MHTKIALILSAGRGERLKPLTLTTPKPLCKIHDTPIINYHIQNLIKAGYEKIIINHAYLGWKIRQNIIKLTKNLPLEIIFSPEPPGGYETGGGICNALKYFDAQVFTVVNADIFTDYDFKNLTLPTQSLARLVLIDDKSKLQGDFGLSAKSLITNQKKFVYSGIACYDRSIFANLKVGRYSVTPILRELADKNQISGEIYCGQWIDIGSIEKLNQANKRPLASQ